MGRVTISSNNLFPGPKGEKGDKGDTGATGAQGPSGVIAVTAPITNSGTSTSANIGVSAGSTSTAGVLQLTDSTSSTSTTTAATPNAVKTVYDFAASEVMPFISTYYYRGIGLNAGNGTAVANTTYYTPFFVPVTTTFDRIAIRTGTTFSGTASVRLGIYNNSGGKPSTVVLDAGTVSATALSTSYTITISQQLTPGLYWLAANSQTAATTNTYLGIGSNQASAYIGQPFTTAFATIQYFTQASVTGAFGTATSLADGSLTAGIYTFLRAA